MIKFLDPCTATLLATHVQSGNVNPALVEFSPEAQAYADNNGLMSILRGSYSFPTNRGLQGATYTHLTRLANHAEVDSCNAIVNDLVYAQFGDTSSKIAGKLAKVIGELHDNVASHARGAGFSCGQVYSYSGRRRFEFSISDSGCGMLANVLRVDGSIQCDIDAIRWCLKRGNTTAKNRSGEWAQRIPEDCVVSPFPKETETFTVEDHHVGVGLWALSELVRLFRGRMWIASGRGAVMFNEGSEAVESNDPIISGVSIELTVPIPDTDVDSYQRNLEELAERLGL
ncbi:MAG: hypothetical protein R3C01_14275 [Planctomycetaceae bacterium]